MKEPILPTESTPICMTEKEWEDMYKRLRLFTYQRYGWLEKNLKSGIDLEGIINESIEAILRGFRKRPEGIDTFFFICEVIRSKVNHIKESAEERRRVSTRTYSQDEVSPDLDILDRDFQLIQSRAENDRQIHYRETADIIRKCVKGDSILSAYVEELIEAPDQKPKEISGKIGVSIERVRNARKRLKRLMPKIKEALGYD